MKSLVLRLLHRPAVLTRLLWPPNALLLSRILWFGLVSRRTLRLGLRELQASLEPKVNPGSPDPIKVQRIVRYTDYLLGGRGPLPRMTCMRRALTLYYFLRREGVKLDICFGVASIERGLEGHCWLMQDGHPFLEKGDPISTFTPILSSNMLLTSSRSDKET